MADPVGELAAFVRARLDEDEQAATRCGRIYPRRWDVSDRGWTATVRAGEPGFRVVAELEQWDGQPEDVWLGDFVDHIARHDPARVLRDVEAARRILDALVRIEHVTSEDGYNAGAWEPLTMLAFPWNDHTDYRPEWRPTP